MTDLSPLDIAPKVAEPPALRACVFVLGGALFAVDVTWAREVVVFDALTRVPRGPSWLAGVANLRGEVMPIVDVRPLLGLPGHRLGAAVRGLVLQRGPVRVAVVIEAALGLEPFTEMLPATGSRFVIGDLPRAGEMATLLDAGAIVQSLSDEVRRPGHHEEDRA